MKQLGQMANLITSANQIHSSDAPTDNAHWRAIEARCNVIGGLAVRLPLDAAARHIVKMPCPAHPIPAKALGTLAEYLRFRGIVLQ